jgi:hypothetical protein
MSKTSFLDDLCLANLQEKEEEEEEEEENNILNNIKTNLRSTSNIMCHFSDFKRNLTLSFDVHSYIHHNNIFIIDISNPESNMKTLINKYNNYITWVKNSTNQKDYNKLRKTHTIDYCLFSFGFELDNYNNHKYYFIKKWEEMIYVTDLKLNNKTFSTYVIKEFIALKNKNNNVITSFYLHLVFKTNNLDKNNIIEKDKYVLITQTSLTDIAKTYPKILYDHLLKAIHVKDLVSIIIKYVQNLNIKNDNEAENKSTFYI